METKSKAERLARAISKNTGRYLAGGIDSERWHRRQCRLWDLAAARGEVEQVARLVCPVVEVAS